VAPPPPPLAAPSRPPAAPRPALPDIESLLGANWLSKLGIAALAIATALFLKYAFDVGWIVPAARVAIGLAFSGALYGCGQFLLRRPRYRAYAQVLAAGGIVVLFLSIYAAYSLYHLIGFAVAFGVLAVGAVAASALAVANNTEGIALICLAGAFATPALIRGETVGGADLLRFYAYLAGLNVWSGILVRFRRWHSLTALAFGATWLFFFGAGHLRGADLMFVEGFAAVFLFFACYGGFVALKGDGKAGPETQRAGLGLILAGCVAFVIASGVIMGGEYPLGLPALASVGVFIALLLGMMGAALPDLGEFDLVARDAFRYLSGVALALLMGISLALATAVPASEVVAAFAFSVFTFVLFLGLAIHMRRTGETEGPAVFLLAVNVITYVMVVFHVLGPQRIWGIDAAPLWLPLAAWITLCTLWLVPRREREDHYFHIATVILAQALPLIGLVAALETADQFPRPLATGIFFGEFILVSATWVAARRLMVSPAFRGDLIAAFGNAVVFFILIAAISGASRPHGVVLLCAYALAFAAYHAGVGGLVLRGSRGDALLRFSYVSLALLFFTIAIPLQLKGSYITFAWALESAVLVWAGLAYGDVRVRWYGVILLAVAACKSVLADMPLSLFPFTLFLNVRMLSGASVAAAAYVSAWLLWRRREGITEEERRVPTLLVLLANLFTLVFVSLDLWNFFGGRPTQQLSLAVFWSAYAAALVWIGARVGDKRVRWAGALLLGAAAGKAFFIDLLTAPEPFRLLLNPRLSSGAAVVAASYFSAWTLWRRRGALTEDERFLPMAYLALANVFTLVFISVDLWDFSAGTKAQFLSLTVFWCVYAAALVLIGAAAHDQRVRWSGAALLFVTAVKAMFLDLTVAPEPFRLLQNPRTLAGASVIVAAYVSAWLLWRKRESLSQDERPLPIILALLANVFTIIFLSLDLWDYLASSRVQLLSLTVFWCAYAAVLMGVGVLARDSRVRWTGVILLTMAALKTAAIDMLTKPEPFRLIANPRMLAAVCVIAAASFCATLLWRGRKEVTDEERSLPAILALAANLFALVFGSLDLWSYFGTTGPLAMRSSAQQLALSTFWSIYALAAMSVGIWRRLKPVRLFAMALLYVAIVKVFLFDLRFLEQPYRIVSFFGLGVILLVVSLLYTRFEERLKPGQVVGGT